MKLYLVLFLLLSSYVTFSQSNEKEVLKLLDSIKAIDPIEDLNVQVNQLTSEIRKTQGNLRSLTQEYKMFEEFCVRQYVYRIIVDALESGITPDTSEIEPFIAKKNHDEWIVDNWSLIEMPSSGSTLPIVIFIDSNDDINPNASDFPIKDFGVALYSGDAILKKVYPNVFNKIKDGKIVFKFKRLSPLRLLFMGVPKLQFPSDLSSSKKKSLESKQKYADELLDWISSVLSDAMKSVGYTSDVLGDYMKIEKKAYTKPTIDEKITLRIQYIQFLKKKYDMTWK
jgi:hypothetical protein